MNGFKIFAKAIQLVLNNGKAAAQIALVPMLLMILVTIGAAYNLRGPGGGAVAFELGVFLAVCFLAIPPRLRHLIVYGQLYRYGPRGH